MTDDKGTVDRLRMYHAERLAEIESLHEELANQARRAEIAENHHLALLRRAAEAETLCKMMAEALEKIVAHADDVTKTHGVRVNRIWGLASTVLAAYRKETGE